MALPTYLEIEKIHFWVPPQPCSLMLILIDKKGKETKVDMLPTHEDLEIFDKEEYTPPPHPTIPRKIYINEEVIELNSPLVKEIVILLKNLIKDNRLGHPEGLTVIMAQEMVTHFSSNKLA